VYAGGKYCLGSGGVHNKEKTINFRVIYISAIIS
jgi:hypothetical protein